MKCSNCLSIILAIGLAVGLFVCLKYSMDARRAKDTAEYLGEYYKDGLHALKNSAHLLESAYWHYERIAEAKVTCECECDVEGCEVDR